MAYVYNMMVFCEGNVLLHCQTYLTEDSFPPFDSAFQILRHPGVTSAGLKAVIPELAAVDPTTLSRIDIDGQQGYPLLRKYIFKSNYSYRSIRYAYVPTGS